MIIYWTLFCHKDWQFIIAADPVMIIVPCQRATGKDGSLTGFRGRLPMKQCLLQLEGKTE